MAGVTKCARPTRLASQTMRFHTIDLTHTDAKSALLHRARVLNDPWRCTSLINSNKCTLAWVAQRENRELPAPAPCRGRGHEHNCLDSDTATSSTTSSCATLSSVDHSNYKNNAACSNAHVVVLRYNGWGDPSYSIFVASADLNAPAAAQQDSLLQGHAAFPTSSPRQQQAAQIVRDQPGPRSSSPTDPDKVHHLLVGQVGGSMDASCMAEVTDILGERVTSSSSSSTSAWRTAAVAVGELLEQQAGPLNIAAVPAAAAEALQEVMTGKGYLVQYNEPCTRFERQGGVPEAAVQRAWTKAQQLKVPMREKQQGSRPPKAAQQGPGCTAEEAVCIQLDSLQQEDAALVNQHWTYSSAGSLGLVQQMIASYPSSCIRLPAATLPLQPCAEPEAPPLDPGSTRRDSPSSSCTQLTEDMQPPSLSGTQASTSLISPQRKNQVRDAQVNPAAAQWQRLCNGTDEGDKEVKDDEGEEEEVEEVEKDGSPLVAVCSRREPGQPVAWALQYNDGSLGMAHCLPAFRRHGLMSLCMADLVDKVLLAGQLQDCVFGYVVDGNAASEAMMRSLGFRCTGRVHWLRFCKPPPASPP